MKIVRTLWVMTLAMTMFSCSNDSIDDVVDNAENLQNKVTLSLDLNTGAGLKARVVEDEEKKVNNVFSSITGEGVINTEISAEFSSVDITRTYVIKSGLQAGDVTVKAWANITEDEKTQNYTDLAQEYSRGFTMFGSNSVQLEVGQAKYCKVDLNRSVAKIHFDNSGNNSELQVSQVFIVNAKGYSTIMAGQGTQLPTAKYYAGDKATETGDYKVYNESLSSLSANINSSTSTADFYVYENMGAGQSEITYLIIKGVFQGQEGYYRWPINQGSIERNYLYTINLKGATVPGTTDPFNDTRDATLTITSSLEPWYKSDAPIEGGELE